MGWPFRSLRAFSVSGHAGLDLLADEGYVEEERTDYLFVVRFDRYAKSVPLIVILVLVSF